MSHSAWWQMYRSAFSPEECQAVVDYGSNFEPVKGKVGHGGKTHESDIRKSTVRWLPRNDKNLRFLFDRLVLNALQVNHLAFHLELSEFPMLRFTHAQLTEYREAGEFKEGDKYDWHEDNSWIAPNPSPLYDRKISCVLQLSPKDSYEGGRLELERDNLKDEDFTEQGDLIYFPSHLRHRVTNVTKGARHSLVVWFEGPPLR